MAMLWSVRYAAGQLAGTRGRLIPLVGWRAPERRPQIVHRNTVACIEGFQRCGNWFAVRTFSDANPDLAPVAHHIHHSGQVERAVAFGVPCVVLIRDPTEAVGSFLVFEPRLTARTAVRSYLRFYETVAEYVDEIAICPFRELIERPGSLIERLNRRYGSDFAAPPVDAADQTAVFNRIERHHPGFPVEKLSTPRPEREKANELARQRARGEPRIGQATALYEKLVGIA